MEKYKKRIIRIAAVFFAVVLVCTFVSKSVYNASLPKVTVQKPKRTQLTHTASTIGVMEFTDAQEVLSGGTWKVEEVFVKPGSSVRVGDPLARINTDSFDLQLLQLEHQLSSIDRALASLQKNTVLQAPFSGVLCEVAALKDGDRVTKGTALARLQDRSALVVTLRFDAQAQEALVVGTVLDVEIEDAETVPGEVLYAHTDGEEFYLVQILIPNPGTLTAGMNAAAVMVDGEKLTAVEPGALAYRREEILTAPFSGTVAAQVLGEGLAVTEGDVLLLGDKNGIDLLYDRKIVSMQLDMLKKEMPPNGVVRAEIAGKVDQVHIKPGKTYYSADVLLTIIPEGSLPELIWYLPAESAKHFDDKASAGFSYTDRGDEKGAKVSILLKSWDSDRQQYKYTAVYSVPDISLSGASLPVEITRRSEIFDYTVPLSAVHGTAAEPVVYIVQEREGLFGKESHVREIAVEVLDQTDRIAAIRSTYLDIESKIIIDSSKPFFKDDAVFVTEERK